MDDDGDDARHRCDDGRFVRLTDDDGAPITLQDALRRRDALLRDAELSGTLDSRRADDAPPPTALDAAKRLGRIQARLVLMGSRTP